MSTDRLNDYPKSPGADIEILGAQIVDWERTVENHFCCGTMSISDQLLDP
jgi:hypothetical protein